jgi:hypothetical protein
MYRIFTEGELDTWREWVRSLSATDVSTPAASSPEATVADRMAQLIDDMRPLQQGEAAHRGPTLTGDNPESPGAQRKEPLAWWFDQPTAVLMATLARPDNGWVVPGDAPIQPARHPDRAGQQRDGAGLSDENLRRLDRR